MPKLTKRYIDGLPNGNQDLIYWDDELRGFGLRIKPSGVRSFLIQYRNQDRLSRKYTFGKYGALTPEQARKEARKLLGGVARGADPSAEKKAASRAMNVRELCESYLKEAKAGRVLNRSGRPKKLSTLKTDEGRIKRHIVPLLGARKVSSLTRQVIQRFMFDVAAGSTAADVKTRSRGRAIVRGGRGTASRTVGLLGGVLTFAMREGVVDSNPARGVERYADQRRDRILSMEEWKALGRALATSETISPTAIAALRLIALTGLRKSEVLGLRWSEVDTAGQCLRLADCLQYPCLHAEPR
jgi:hypothetical protein